MNFGNTIAEIARKSMRERKKKISDVMEEREKIEFQ